MTALSAQELLHTVRNITLLRAAGWVTGGSGILTAVQLIEGDGSSLSARQARDDAEERLRHELEEQHLDAYPLRRGRA